VTIPKGDISTLLQSGDLADVAGVSGLTTMQVDMKSAAGAVDPSQVEHMDSFVSLTFTSSDGSKNLILTTIDFESEFSATGHAGLMMCAGSGMLDLSPRVGDEAVYLEPNSAGIGSMVVFRKGEWVVTLHTAQADGVEPLVDLPGVTALGRLVADRL
jgi:hypothetical protein